jgi:hypothetical protein
MIKSIYFPDRTFATKEHLFEAMKLNEEMILTSKKTERKSDNFGLGFSDLVAKSFAEKGMRIDEEYIYPVLNTTLLMDSHDDVQLNNSWNKTAKDQSGKIFYVVDHKLEVDKIIAHPQDVELLIKNFTFKELGIDYDGSTQALMMKINKSAIKMPQVMDIINNKYPMQNSVREQYVKIRFAVNSKSPDFVNEKAHWDEIYPQVANKERPDEKGYLFAVDESKVIKESSMVLFGSNHVTPVLQSNKEDIEPDYVSTQTPEPIFVTPKGTEFFTNLLK